MSMLLGLCCYTRYFHSLRICKPEQGAHSLYYSAIVQNKMNTQAKIKKMIYYILNKMNKNKNKPD